LIDDRSPLHGSWIYPLLIEDKRELQNATKFFFNVKFFSQIKVGLRVPDKLLNNNDKFISRVVFFIIALQNVT